MFGRLSNMFDFFKYAFFTFGDYFINGTGLGMPDDTKANSGWRMIDNPYPSPEGRDAWMPHNWLRKGEYYPNEQSFMQRYQFIIGLGSIIVAFNIIPFLLLRCKRWDKR